MGGGLLPPSVDVMQVVKVMELYVCVSVIIFTFINGWVEGQLHGSGQF